MSHRSLRTRLTKQISAGGPISVADYMAIALGDPDHGYYASRDPFGEGGDFVTAPEISQMFGEIVGAWLCHGWQAIGAPSPFHLVELGPGRGTLMRDILRVAGHVPGFLAAVEIHLVETSASLREVQAETLGAHREMIAWHDRIDELPDVPLLFVANEFFDALPIRQFLNQDGVWHERVIGLDGNGALAFGLGPGRLTGPAPVASNGDIFEISPTSTAILTGLSQHLTRFGGLGLIIDYGHVTSAVGDTFQAVRAHQFADPLSDPGEADLTAHVDFAALGDAARSAGGSVLGPISQADFLTGLGLLERAGRLGAGKSPDIQTSIGDAVNRLIGADQMGDLFKVMAVTGKPIALPPFPASISN